MPENEFRKKEKEDGGEQGWEKICNLSSSKDSVYSDSLYDNKAAYFYFSLFYNNFSS